MIEKLRDLKKDKFKKFNPNDLKSPIIENRTIAEDTLKDMIAIDRVISILKDENVSRT